ncbi:MAG: FAD:protein FMN transferase [Candidatus Nanopelagicales bacterium]|jgi:thiamine biosynthesis lipoprotein|nr:FAD:protein FMN transferase [Candidatus Nanopelagicales bacterium]
MTEAFVHHVRTWGTVIVIDIRAELLDHSVAQEACEAAAQELAQIDALFSTYREDSAVTAIRQGRMRPADAPALVRTVIDACTRLRERTDGAFDPWAVSGGFDPSGFVKGWGADRAADTLMSKGVENVSVNAAGDVTCRGEAEPGQGGWRIGVADPRDPMQIITSALVTNAHLATSGRYERGDHIVDPASGLHATEAASASVLCASGGDADALATALMVRGPAGLPWIAAPSSAYLISGDRVWLTGDAFVHL